VGSQNVRDARDGHDIGLPSSDEDGGRARHPRDPAAAAPIAIARIGFCPDLPDHQDARGGGKVDPNGWPTLKERRALRVAGIRRALVTGSRAPERGRWDLAQRRLDNVIAGERAILDIDRLDLAIADVGAADLAVLQVNRLDRLVDDVLRADGGARRAR